MRVIVGAFALLICPARCLLRVAVPPAPAMASQPAPAARAVDAIPGGAIFTSGGHRRSSRRRALIAKVHRVARGGGGQERKGILAHAVSLPLVQALPPQAQTALLVNTVGFGLLEATGKRGSILTSAGTFSAYVLGLVLWSTLGGWGWGTAVLYLMAGSAVTKLKMEKKESLGIAEGRGGARGPENVWGSAATGAMCAVASLVWPQWSGPLRIGYVASLATKLSDTFASEIGKAYGKHTFLITTFKPVPAGTEGAVSLEGTLAGVVGSVIISGFAAAAGVVTAKALPACLIAAFVATNFESVLGATTQGKVPWLTNEVVNFVNTVVGAAVGVGLGLACGV
ncbi:unnamed protein product [Ectocarpus sp. 12 AP-2014]